MTSIAGLDPCAQQRHAARRTVGGGTSTRGSGRDLARPRAVGRAAEPPLDKTQSYETHAARPLGKPVDREVARKRTSQRYHLLGGLRRLSSKKRVRKCKTPIGQSHVGLVGHGEGGAHFTGVESCANVWACSVCAPKIRAGRTTDVLDAFERHTANGGGFVFVTVTLPHNLGHRLAELVGLLSEAWTYVTRQRGYKEWRKRAGLLGYVAALEVTRGEEHGWHPHRHLMFFTETPPSEDTVRAWEAELHALYSRLLAKKGWKAPKEHVGVRMDYVGKPHQAVARYITKMQAGFELTRSDLKKSRAATGQMPFDLLELAMEDDAAALALWREYEQAMTGKSAVRFSKGLRALLGMLESKTDEELAEEEVGGDPGLYVSAPLFRRMIKDGRRGELLLAYGQGGELAVLQLVHSWYGGQAVAVEEERLHALVLHRA